MPRLLTVREAVSKASIEIGIAQYDLRQVMGALDQDVTQMAGLLSAVADAVVDEEPYAVTLGDGNWISHADGSVGDAPNADADIILFDGRLAVIGLKYRFKKEKGLEYGEDMRDFHDRLNKLAHRANAKVIDRDADEGRQL